MLSSEHAGSTEMVAAHLSGLHICILQNFVFNCKRLWVTH
jgi:hypothetical protein